MTRPVARHRRVCILVLLNSFPEGVTDKLTLVLEDRANDKKRVSATLKDATFYFKGDVVLFDCSLLRGDSYVPLSALTLKASLACLTVLHRQSAKTLPRLSENAKR
jgi:hypothetical protein